jgi:hypothetical protein
MDSVVAEWRGQQRQQQQQQAHERNARAADGLTLDQQAQAEIQQAQALIQQRLAQ